MTVNEWLDSSLGVLHGRTVRIINTDTHKGVGDMIILYMDRPVKKHKITKEFVFLFI